MTKGYEFVCTTCGYTVPADNDGVALLEAHLKKKHKKAEVVPLPETPSPGTERQL
jgi:hypothetical protein